MTGLRAVRRCGPCCTGSRPTVPDRESKRAAAGRCRLGWAGQRRNQRPPVVAVPEVPFGCSRPPVLGPGNAALDHVSDSLGVLHEGGITGRKGAIAIPQRRPLPRAGPAPVARPCRGQAAMLLGAGPDGPGPAGRDRHRTASMGPDDRSHRDHRPTARGHMGSRAAPLAVPAGLGRPSWLPIAPLAHQPGTRPGACFAGPPGCPARPPPATQLVAFSAASRAPLGRARTGSA